jgi:hypothetical protein
MAGMSEQEPKPSRPPAQEEGDAFCLECGYNLRGLSGYVLRCPECGATNPGADVEMPEELLRKHLGNLRTVPLNCAALSLVGIVLGLPALALSIVLPIMFIGAALVLIFWVTTMLRFRSACQVRPGWAVAFAIFQLLGLALLAAIIAGSFAGFAAVAWVADNWLPAEGNARTVALVLLFGILLLSICAATSLGLDKLIHALDPLFEREARRQAWSEMSKRASATSPQPMMLLVRRPQPRAPEIRSLRPPDGGSESERGKAT